MRLFERTVPRSMAPALIDGQKSVAPTEPRYRSIAFALAYYGVDIAGNVERLVRRNVPKRKWTSRDYRAYDQLPIDPWILFRRTRAVLVAGSL